MKFTLSWLKDHLETDAPLDAIADKLTMLGLEVEDVVDPAKDLAAYTVAHVVSAERHPDADKLQVCKVDTGSGTEQVVCGAPNARAGMKGVFAPVGTYVPGAGFELKVAKIRGVESRGMLCSERELELSEEHDGIIELPEDAEVGTPAAAALGLDDPMIDIAITPNRPDCLGVHGVARDLAAGGLGTLTAAAAPAITGAFDSPITIGLHFEGDSADACPIFAGRYVRGVKNGPSPEWLQKRLRAVGLRPINALVDITNYISYDRARPLHVYDADKVTGEIHARLGRTGEKFLALDGEEYEVDGEMCVIADDSGVLGLGGIMGGEASGSTEATVNVFIESAYFDPIRTAMTGRKLGIESDARYRFERGVDPAYVVPGLDLATQMVLEICGGEASGLVVAGEVPQCEPVISFDPGLVAKRAGLHLGNERIRDILTALGFGVTEAGALYDVRVPSWRPDVHGPADLVEEVTRVNGVDNVPSTPMTAGAEGASRAVAAPVLSQRQRRARWARRVLAARGLDEAVTWSFLPEDHAALFGGGGKAVELANPISSELSHMRPSLLPNLIAAAGRNMDRGFADLALFEVGPQFHGGNPGEQTLAVSGIRRGTAGLIARGRHWQGAGKPVDVFDAKADALAVLEACGAPAANAQTTTDAPAWYHPGRSGVLRLGPKNVLAYFGELHPRVLDAMDVKGPLVGFEIVLDTLPEPKRKATRSKPPLEASDLQAVERDFAFVVDETVSAEAVIRAASGADKKLIARVDVFDVFAGASLGEGKKSIAIAVTLQPRDKTLTDQEIDAVADKIVAAVAKSTGGALRG